MFLKKLKWDNMAFMFLNRYIDLADAIDDENGDMLDNADFVNTDIPFEINLPPKKYLSVNLIKSYDLSSQIKFNLI
jgi:intraflagellar transport protein 172